MARPFTPADARELLSEHRIIKKKFNDIKLNIENLKFQIRVSVDRLIDSNIRLFLKEVPIEELNRDKQGIKTKLLREEGYESVADIINVDFDSIEAINGIGVRNANTIISKVEEFVEEARKNTRIRISSDDRNPDATALISSICVYKNSLTCVNIVNKIESIYGNKIDYAVNTLVPFINGLRWFFSSSLKKSDAVDAYDYLLSQLYGAYGDDSKQVISIYEHIQRSAIDEWKDFEENSIQYFTLLEELIPGIVGSGDILYGLPEELAHQIEKQEYSLEGFNCTLRRYQEWGVKYILHQKRVLLGDEMGLGKTIQAIAAMVALRNSGETHFLVVCPASVLSNWCREITRGSNLRVIKIYGSGREQALHTWIDKGGAAVTTYETMEHVMVDDAFRFGMLVVDEAHYIKNKETKRSSYVRGICTHSDRLLFMTGTALENNVSEMISLIEALRPDIAKSIEDMAFMSTAPQFREEIAPVYYRRKREEVLLELPELIEKKEWCTLSRSEELAYEQALYSKNYSNIRRVSWNVESITDSSKARRLTEIIENAKDDNRKIIVFSYFLDTIASVCSFLGEICLQPITGSVSVERRQEIVDEFDRAPSGTVLVAQIQSGGTGLNIQSASVVVLCEPQLKPSIENQAVSRAYRMGQSRNVLVYRLLSDDTIDELIVNMLEEKQAIFDAFADKSVAAMESYEIDDKSFGKIVQEELDRVTLKKQGDENR